MLRRWLLIWLCALSLIAYLWPSSLWDPFQATRAWLPYVFAMTMFALGWLLPVDEVRQVFRRWPLVLGGTTLQYLSMPLLAWLVTRSLPLSDDLRLGIIMVGCVPGAMASNVLTLLARGNVSYSLTLTTLATCLSPLAVPLALKLTLGAELDRSYTDLVVRLCWMVLLPVIAGFSISTLAGYKDRFNGVFEGMAAGSILWIIAVVVASNRSGFGHLTDDLLIAVLVLNLGGYTVGLFGARLMTLDAPMKRALVLEIGMQNAGLGTTLASEFFKDRPAAMIPTALYTFGCMLTGTCLAWYWSRRSNQANGINDELSVRDRDSFDRDQASKGL